MSLPGFLADLLAPLVVLIGSAIEKSKLKGRYGPERIFTKVRHSAWERSVLYIPDWVLNDPSPENWNAVAAVQYTFNPDTLLIIFSDDKLDAPAKSHRSIIDEVWPTRGITGYFIPSRDVEEIRKATNKDEQIELLKQSLKVDGMVRQYTGSVLTLDGNGLEAFQKALLSAFDKSSLEQMMKYKLDQNLEYVAGGKDLGEIVFNLLKWAQSNGRLGELLERAINYKPGNEELQAFAKQYQKA